MSFSRRRHIYTVWEIVSVSAPLPSPALRHCSSCYTRAETPYRGRHCRFGATLPEHKVITKRRSQTKEVHQARDSECRRLQLGCEASDAFGVGSTRSTADVVRGYIQHDVYRRKPEPAELKGTGTKQRGNVREEGFGPSNREPWDSEGRCSNVNSDYGTVLGKFRVTKMAATSAWNQNPEVYLSHAPSSCF